MAKSDNPFRWFDSSPEGIDRAGEVLESYVTRERDKAAVLTFIKKALKRHGRPKAIVTDGLYSYKAALEEISAADRQQIGRWENNRGMAVDYGLKAARVGLSAPIRREVRFGLTPPPAPCFS